MKTEKVIFKNSKGMKIVGILQTPEGKGQFPAVIICHGFKGVKQQEHMTRIAEDLAKGGFVALRFDFTNGLGESEGDMYNLTVTGELDDLNSAIDFVKSLKYVNKNIGITGASLGGFDCLLIASERSDVKCMVGLSSLFHFSKSKGMEERIKEAKEKGYAVVKSATFNKTFKISKQFFDDALGYDIESAVKKIKCPVLIIHGEKDESISLQEAKALYSSLACEKDLKIIKNAPHTYKKDPELGEVSKETVNWFKRYLL
jgi:dienelactone hydrolase